MQARIRTGVMALAVGLATAAVGEAQAPIRIGASLGLTGTYAELGHALRRGYQLCLKHANEKGGVLGRPLELSVEDDQSQTETAVAIYEKLLADNKVTLVFSPYSSPITDAVAEVTEQDGKKVIVWPEELAPGKPRFPTRPWNQR